MGEGNLERVVRKRESVKVILVLRECIGNAPAVSLFLRAFDDTGSQGYPPRRVVYRPVVSTLGTASRFLAGNREVEFKPTILSSLLLFRVFLSILLSRLPSDIAP